MPRQWMNLFEIRGLDEVELSYRLLKIDGLVQEDAYDKNVNQLCRNVAYEVKGPVALVRRGGHHYLALPADAPLPKLEQRLVPHVAQLEPLDGEHRLRASAADPEATAVATAFLNSAVRQRLFRNQDLWESGRSSFAKRPLPREAGSEIDVYPGFSWNIVTGGDGRFFLAVDTTVRYVDSRWLHEQADQSNARHFHGRHCLYHFGDNWYIVQLRCLTGRTIAEQRFQPQNGAKSFDVYSYTLEHCEPRPWVAALDPDSPAIMYRYPGNEQNRFGALALCKLVIPTADERAKHLHRRAIVEPRRRLREIRGVVDRHFPRLHVAGAAVEVATEPLEVERKVFAIPSLRFGNNRVLSVASRAGDGKAAVDAVPLQRFGRRRLELVLDPKAGPIDRSPFGRQFIVVPESAPRRIMEAFRDCFIEAMREVSGQPYQAQLVVFRDREATSLPRQVDAIKEALSRAGARDGFALLVLPDRAAPDLHNYIKTELWPDLQVQCATVQKIRSHFERRYDGVGYAVQAGRRGRLISYARNCALGMMTVNRKWLWALENPLHHDLYIGIDVLNRRAGLTFVYDRGRKIFFRDYPCRQAERLTARQLRNIVADNIRRDCKDFGFTVKSILVQRDGRTYASELKGLHDAIAELRKELVLPIEVTLGVVEIHKSNANHLRLFEGESLDRLENPTIGAYCTISAREGIVATTGQPFRSDGTAQPLAVTIVEGELAIMEVLEDVFALSQCGFSAPDKCARLPVTIKLTDEFLQPIAADVDDEEAIYEVAAADVERQRRGPAIAVR